MLLPIIDHYGCLDSSPFFCFLRGLLPQTMVKFCLYHGLSGVIPIVWTRNTGIYDKCVVVGLNLVHAKLVDSIDD